MAPIEELLTVQHAQGAIAIIGVWIFFKLLDHLLEQIIHQKIFTTAYETTRKKLKAILTRKKNITSDLEFSIYLYPELTLPEARQHLDNLIRMLEQESNGEIDVEEVRWNSSKTDVDLSIVYSGSTNPHMVNLNFSAEESQRSPGENPPVSSIGVSISFQFPFHNLRGAIITLSACTQFIHDAMKSTYPVKSITNGRFVVYPLENDLTLDDWIQKEQFDVSLLLQSQNEKRSVRFFNDRAEIESPHTQIDEETVDYIRATLLNYYL